MASLIIVERFVLSLKINEKKYWPFENINMYSNGLIILIILLSLGSQSHAQDSSDIFYICKRDRMVRWLKAYKLENGKCQTLYSKEGYLQVVSSATYFTSCEGVLHSVEKNLVEGGFSCNQIQKHAYVELE